ncbi:MAG: hypothetical protein HRU76_06285 [Phycisphaeraceae bacterium]|nr:MAG: hypothetical protein HRU76_06285 [Phycisphaeraceae bacterium]
MHPQKRRILTSTSIAGAVAAACCGAAGADILNSWQLTDGQTSASFTLSGVNVTVESFNGAFKGKTVGGFSGVGVGGGSVAGEIDNLEFIRFSFSQPVNVISLSLGALYTAGNYGDTVHESALITTDLGSHLLIASGATSGSWNGFGTLQNDSPATQGQGGAWTISGSSIFAGPITTLTLASGNPGPSNAGDFTFRSIAVEQASIPAPGAGLLFAAAGVMVLGRRRRRR